MKTLEELRRRISNVEDVQSVVSTMKTMAAVHIRQYETAANAMAEYLRTIELGFHVLLRDRAIPSSEPSRRCGAIIFGSDQGLCGKFNEDIVQYAMSDMIESQVAEEWRILVIGNRATPFMQTSHVQKVFRVPTTVADITPLLQELMPYVEAWRREGVRQINVFFNGRTSVATYSPESFQLFPISFEFLEQCRAQPWASRGLPTHTMDWQALFASVVRHYLFVGLYRACAESRASENASRIASMRTASKNIDRRLHELRKEFNETRQAAITEEILEIASGVEALNDRE